MHAKSRQNQIGLQKREMRDGRWETRDGRWETADGRRETPDGRRAGIEEDSQSTLSVKGNRISSGN